MGLPVIRRATPRSAVETNRGSNGIMPYVDPLRKRANARRYYLINRAHFKRKSKAYRKSHPREIREMKRRWALKPGNRDKMRQWGRSWAARNRQYQRDWYRGHLAHSLAQSRKWQKANPAKKRQISLEWYRRRRAAIRQLQMMAVKSI